MASAATTTASAACRMRSYKPGVRPALPSTSLPGDDPRDISQKTDVYLRAGTVRVLVVDPARRTTSMHDSDGTVVFAVADAHASGSIFASTRVYLSTFGPTPD